MDFYLLLKIWVNMQPKTRAISIVKKFLIVLKIWSRCNKNCFKKAVQKTAEATGDLIGNKIAGKISKASKNSLEEEAKNEIETPKER